MFIHHSVSGVQAPYDEPVKAQAPSPFNFTDKSKKTSFNFEYESKVKIEPESYQPKVKTQVDFCGRTEVAAESAESSDSKHVERPPVFQSLPKTPNQKDIWEALAERLERADTSSVSNKTFKVEVEIPQTPCARTIFTQSIHQAMPSLQNGEWFTIYGANITVAEQAIRKNNYLHLLELHTIDQLRKPFEQSVFDHNF
jgi:hypothetical protein